MPRPSSNLTEEQKAKYRSKSTWSHDQGVEMARRGREARSAKLALRKAAGLPPTASPPELQALALLRILSAELSAWTQQLIALRARGARADLARARQLVALISDLRRLEENERARAAARTWSPANGASTTSAKLPTLAPLPSAVQQTPSIDSSPKLDATPAASSTSSTDDLEPLTPEPIE